MMLTHPQFDPIIFSLGPLAVRWYGLMYVLAFVLFVVLGRMHLKRRPDMGFTTNDLDDLLFFGILGVILGGRLGYIFFYNVKQYNLAKNAYLNAIDGNPANDYLIPQPYFSVKDNPERIRTFRNQVRQNVDYTVLFFIIFWGLNVVDATVDAHLKTFDVSDDLGLYIKPGYSQLANTNGISLVLKFR